MLNAKEILSQYPPERENVLLILHALQNNNPQHYLGPEDLALTANYLNTTQGVIYGIASYYSMFSLEPRGRTLIRICNSPVCHVFQNFNLITEVGRLLQVEVNETTADGQFTLELTECIGCCDGAPAMMVNGNLEANLNPTQLHSLLNPLRQKEIEE